MWEISVGNQAITLLLSLCLGGILSLIYDILRAMHKTGFNSFLAVFITDILFWIFSALITFIFLMSRTNGEIRAYVLLAQCGGFVAFRFTISKLWFKALCVCFGFVVKIKTISRRKINVIYDKTESVLIAFFKQSLTKSKNVLKSIKKLLKKVAKMLYTVINIKSAENDSYETKT